MTRSLTTVTAVAALLAASPALAWSWGCEHERELEARLDLAGADQLQIDAAAGDLEIRGVAGLTEARIRGRACASKEEWADESDIVTEGGRDARISVSLPDTSGWSFMGSRYAAMDLEIEVPDNLPLKVRDSSGDVDIRGTGAVDLQDSSGDIDLRGLKGGVRLADSSGDIDLSDIAGDVTVRSDSSGDIEGRDIRGSVRVERDSSGEIRFREVSGDFIVERDSSGDIVADTVGGDFRVEQDSSGEIRSNDVSGEVDVPGES